MAGFIGLVCLLAVTSASPASRTIHNVALPSKIPSEFLVSVKPNMVRGQSLKQTMDNIIMKIVAFSNQISVVAQFDFHKLSVLLIKSESESLVAQLYNFPEVSSIEANVYDQVADQECVEQSVPRYWNLERIGNRERLFNRYSYREDDGAGGYVYVMDSGIRTTHNEFGGRAIHGFTAPDVNEEEGDFRGHGTHCAGIVIGSTHGVAKAAGAIAVKVMDALGFGTTSGALAALEWIKEDFTARDAEAGGNFPAVVSISLTYAASDAFDGAVQELFDVGLVTTTSAGNFYTSACNFSPGRAEAAITVMASDINDVLALSSNREECCDIIAPGTNISSAYIGDDDERMTISGTSQASPHVAGTLLRYMTQTIAATGRRPSATELKNWISDNSTKGVINIRGLPNTKNYFLYAPCDLTA